MTPSITLPLSVERATAFLDFLWAWLRAVEPSTIDLRIVDGTVWVRNAEGWTSLGAVAGWLRLARALGALRSK